MAHEIREGSKVTFHFDSNGQRRSRPARVVYVYSDREADPKLELAALIVEFAQEDFDDGSAPIRLQSTVPRGNPTNILSGTWTAK